jgi:hypothetical protein
VVRVRMAAPKQAGLLEAALDRHLGRPREGRRSLCSLLAHPIKSPESHGYAIGVKAEIGERERGDAVSVDEHAKEHMPGSDVVCPHCCGMIASDTKGTTGAFGEQQHRAKASHAAAALGKKEQLPLGGQPSLMRDQLSDASEDRGRHPRRSPRKRSEAEDHFVTTGLPWG